MPPSVEPDKREYLLLLDVEITLMEHGDDWLQLMLDLAWRPELTVNAAVQAACRCQVDHRGLSVRDMCKPVANSQDLIDGFAAAVVMLRDVLDSGPFDPGSWRMQAGLPDTPL